MSEEITKLQEKYRKAESAVPVKETEVGFALESLDEAKKEANALEKQLFEKLGSTTLPYAKEVVAAVGDYDVLKEEIDRYNADKIAVENSIKQISDELPDDDYSEERFEMMRTEAKLSEENKKMFFIPKNFAHGFLVLSDYAEFVYKCTDFYHPGDEGGIMWNDPDIGIDWPIEEGLELTISDKDKKWGGIKDLGKDNIG